MSTALKGILRHAAGAAMAMAIGTAFCAAPSVAETWKFYTYSPQATHPNVMGMQRLADAVEEATGGKLKMKVNVGGSLPISSTDIAQAVADNIVQIGADGFFLGNIRIGGVLRLPMLLNSREDYAKAAAVMEPYIDEALAEQGVTLLAQYVYPLQSAWSAKPLASLADMDGQKMRVTSPEQAEFVQRFGGVPVTIGAPEVAPSLQRGVVDGVFTASAGGGRIWGEMLKSNYRLGPNYFNSLIIVNTRALERLSPEDQAIVRKAAIEAAAWTTDQLESSETEITKDLAAKGMVITQASQADIDKAIATMQDYWVEWAKGVSPKAEEALAKVRAAVGH